VGNGVLASDGGAVCEPGADVVGEIGVDGGQDGDVFGDTADAGEEVDCGFEGAGEEAGSVFSIRRVPLVYLNALFGGKFGIRSW
jgi:hypothetical protein